MYNSYKLFESKRVKENNMKVARRVDKANKIRSEGLTPGVIIGKDIESTSIQVESRKILQAYRTYGQSRAFKIELDGEIHNVYFKEVQILILRPNDIIHFSLQKVSATDTISAAIPILLLGRHEVENKGLLVQHIMQSIEVDYPAMVVIDNIEVDVSTLEAGDAIYVKDIKLPEDITTKIDGEEMIANAVYPRLAEEDEEETVEVDTEDADVDTDGETEPSAEQEA